MTAAHQRVSPTPRISHPFQGRKMYGFLSLFLLFLCSMHDGNESICPVGGPPTPHHLTFGKVAIIGLLSQSNMYALLYHALGTHGQ